MLLKLVNIEELLLFIGEHVLLVLLWLLKFFSTLHKIDATSCILMLIVVTFIKASTTTICILLLLCAHLHKEIGFVYIP